MEPIKINVNIEVGLKQTTLDALSQIFGTRVQTPAITAEAPKAAPKEDADPQPEKPQPKKPQPKKAPAPEPEPKPADPVEYDDDDLPPGNAPDPVKPMPTESDARNAVAAAKKRGVTAAAIKSYMKTEFNISSSVECPAERRQELIDGLNKLAA